MTKNKISQTARKRGVALIITVGFLAVLVLLAVAFSISMRVERLAARNFADTVQSRQWAQSAISYAMNDADAIVGNSVFFSAGTRVIPSPGAVTFANLLTGAASNYVPASLWADAAVPANYAKWTSVSDGSKVIARYAYQIFDCSGFIDANFGGITNVFAPTVRGLATNALDLCLSNSITPEIVAGKEVLMKNGRFQSIPGVINAPWYQFQSLADMWFTLRTSGSPSMYGAGFLSSFPSNFMTDSRSLPGWLSNTVVNSAVYLGRTAAETMAQQSQIRSEFVNMGVAAADADFISIAAVDYADSDCTPTIPTFAGTVAPATEPFPMFNEVVISSTVSKVTMGGTNFFNCTNRVIVELWYPFVSVTNINSYNLEITARFTGSGFPTQTTPTYKPTINGPWTQPTFVLVSLTNSFSVTNPAVPPDWSKLSALVALRETDAGGNYVDSVYGTKSLTINLGAANAGNNQGDPTPFSFSAGRAADDPRFNWDGTDPKQWIAEPLNVNTLSSNNSNVWTTFVHDGVTNLYIANRPFQSVGELGLLLSGCTTSFWSSIRLLNSASGVADALPVLSRFTLTQSNAIEHGRVNLNSTWPAVMGTVFNMAKAEAYPGDPAAVAVDAANALTIGGNIAAKGIFTNVADIAKITDAGVSVGSSPAQKEGIIRNSAELLTTRQNLYTIIVAAQTLADDGSATSEQRALAVVWRDPFPNGRKDGSGKDMHDMFIRSFRWLTD